MSLPINKVALCVLCLSSIFLTGCMGTEKEKNPTAGSKPQTQKEQVVQNNNTTDVPPQKEQVGQNNNTTAAVTRKPYTNNTIGFSMNVPEKVINEAGMLSPLNILETGEKVYFTTHTLAETIDRQMRDFRIGGTTVKNQKQILPFLENFYGVTGCQIEFNTSPEDTFQHIGISAKNPNLPPETAGGCRIWGKVRTIYDEKNQKVRTYQLPNNAPFFVIPGDGVEGNSASDKALESLKFLP